MTSRSRWPDGHEPRGAWEPVTGPSLLDTDVFLPCGCGLSLLAVARTGDVPWISGTVSAAELPRLESDAARPRCNASSGCCTDETHGHGVFRPVAHRITRSALHRRPTCPRLLPTFAWLPDASSRLPDPEGRVPRGVSAAARCCSAPGRVRPAGQAAFPNGAFQPGRTGMAEGVPHPLRCHQRIRYEDHDVSGTNPPGAPLSGGSRGNPDLAMAETPISRGRRPSLLPGSGRANRPRQVDGFPRLGSVFGFLSRPPGASRFLLRLIDAGRLHRAAAPDDQGRRQADQVGDDGDRSTVSGTRPSNGRKAALADAVPHSSGQGDATPVDDGRGEHESERISQQTAVQADRRWWPAPSETEGTGSIRHRRRPDGS